MTVRTPSRVAALIAATLPLLALATVVEDLSFEQLSERAHVIVRGRVGPQQARWDAESRRIQTYTELAVTETFKGKVEARIRVRQPGGEVGEVGQFVAGTARFTEGEEVLLFLEAPPDDRSVFVVLSMAAGKVELRPTGAFRDARGLGLYREASVREVDAPEYLGPVETFLARIRKAVAR